MLIIRNSTLDWLLEEENQPVRYLTLKNLLESEPDDQELVKARNAIKEYSPVNKILGTRDEFLPGESRKYTPYKKYQGLYWQLLFLSDLHAIPGDSRIEECCEAVIDLQHKNGGFPCTAGVGVIACLTGNQLRALTTLGYADHPAVEKGYHYLAKGICETDGIPCSVINYSIYQSCYMTLPRTLKAFNEYPYTKQDKLLTRARDTLTEQLYSTKIFRYVNSNAPIYQDALKLFFKDKKSSAEEKKKFKEKFIQNNPGIALQEKKNWKRLAFPLHYNPNILEAVEAVADTGDIRMDLLFESLEILFDKKSPNDRWKMESSLNGKMLADIEKKGDSSKWITYHVLSVFKKSAGLKFLEKGEKSDEIFD